MTTELPPSDPNEIIKQYKQAEKLEEDGYKDLAFTLQQNAIHAIAILPAEEKQKVVDALFPKK